MFDTLLKGLRSPQSTAKVVDGKLVLSLPGALKPIVWQMDFETYKASALEVSDKEESFLLMLKTPEGKEVEIAPFAQKDEAVQSLMAVSRALEKGVGEVSGSGLSFKKLLTPVLAIVFLFVLLSVWASLTPLEPVSVQGSSAVGQAPTTGPQTGVPMSADAFLSQ